ncbi:glycosyltransferase [Pseudoprimorskyibacter insulae]|uniref:Beta-monoglucosyldiacylglycerol synthase n=1 Tax=Pseudoprimorskyibacter insulae TaxID=1695997 RepID=A0A2R8ARF5_9RHOB|nr:glycosyltransferase [Pseudoprimorskyibacter insulae]SPF78467.1 Beta-monoglucosyldiacylglycerol synthase [Pseudoprimorskyibacter insulae]
MPLHATNSGTHQPPIGRLLMERGGIGPAQLRRALGESALTGASLMDTAQRIGAISPVQRLDMLTRYTGATVFSLDRSTPDAGLMQRLGQDFCLQNCVLPWGHMGPATWVATSQPDTFDALRPTLEARLGPIIMALCSEQDIHNFIAATCAEDMAQQAETWVPDDESCRDLNRWTPARAAIGAGLGLCAVGLLALAPQVFFLGVLALATISLLAAQVAKVAAWVNVLRMQRRPAMNLPMPDRYPLVSILVPLFREGDIASALVNRLSRLTYPKSRLDVALVLEAGDDQTRGVLAGCELPQWMRVIEVPGGSIQTKPRAMNYAIRYCRGDIIGIYDAEDAPAPDQLHKVVGTFQRAPPQVACVQAILDFYNSKANWLSRCFAVEYATWFRVMLPGYARLGFAIPLGGTSVFFRREALMKVRGWDAHNVTEDADLGLRLARHGYKTALVPSVTREEANNRAWPWVKQRSRWLKGYMVTYLVHMRRPLQLWSDLGATGFAGVQIMFLAALLQFLLAPALWSFWLISLSGLLPVTGLTSGHVTQIGWLFLSTEAFCVLIGLTAVALSPHRQLFPWVPTMMLYFPLGVLAAYKALYELVVKPFYWDKTSHGHSAPDGDLDPQA